VLFATIDDDGTEIRSVGAKSVSVPLFDRALRRFKVSDLPSRDLDWCLDHAALLKEGRNPPYPSLYVQNPRRVKDAVYGGQICRVAPSPVPNLAYA
jgi:hypothetical protein